MFTPSAVQRVEACPLSEALPHTYRETEAAALGTIAHQFMADVREHGRDAALDKVAAEHGADMVRMCEAIPLDDPRMPSLDPRIFTAELAMGLDLDSGEARVLGKGMTRKQAHALARPGEMIGIADLAGQEGRVNGAEGTGAVVVLDLKFGHGHVPRAAVNMQTDTYLLMLSRALGAMYGRAGIVRVWGDEVWTDVVERDPLELDDHFELLRDLARLVDAIRATSPASARPPPVEGHWCTYCPAFLHCPAKRALLAEVVRDPDAALQPPTDGAITPAQLGAGWLRVKRARQVVERVEAAYKELARIEPIPLGDGKVLGEREIEHEGLDDYRAAKILSEQLAVGAVPIGRTIADAARTQMTWASLKRALEAHLMPLLPRTAKGKPQPYAPVERDIRKLLADGGAVSKYTTREIREHTPKGDK